MRPIKRVKEMEEELEKLITSISRYNKSFRKDRGFYINKSYERDLKNLRKIKIELSIYIQALEDFTEEITEHPSKISEYER